MITTVRHKKRLKGLYAITDQQLIHEQAFSRIIELALQGGTKIIQYRDKSNDTEKRIQQKELTKMLTEYER